MDDVVRRLLHVQVLLAQVRRVVARVPGTPSARLVASVCEENNVIHQVLTFAQAQALAEANLKERMTALYHADEATQRLGKQWVRWLAWERGQGSYTERRDVERWLHTIFREMSASVPALVARYGEQETKYIVPVDYRPQTTKGV